MKRVSRVCSLVIKYMTLVGMRSFIGKLLNLGLELLRNRAKLISFHNLRLIIKLIKSQIMYNLRLVIIKQQ